MGACASQKEPLPNIEVQTEVAEIVVPSGLRTCSSEPNVPVKPEDGSSRQQSAVRDYVGALINYGADCKRTQQALVRIIDNHNSNVSE